MTTFTFSHFPTRLEQESSENRRETSQFYEATSEKLTRLRDDMYQQASAADRNFESMKLIVSQHFHDVEAEVRDANNNTLTKKISTRSSTMHMSISKSPESSSLGSAQCHYFYSGSGFTSDSSISTEQNRRQAAGNFSGPSANNSANYFLPPTTYFPIFDYDKSLENYMRVWEYC